jgi:hypothetical protein
MKRRSSTPVTSLDARDASLVKGMLRRGDRQHDIAAWFGVNGGRIAEIAAGKKFPEVRPEVQNLPPPGPYVAMPRSALAVSNLMWRE